MRVEEAQRAADLPAGALGAADQAALDESAPTVEERQRTVVVLASSSGDYSTYTLRIVADTEPPVHHPDFDPILHETRFSFKVECPSEFDCRPREECVTAEEPGPRIDYLAKDYASFRRLMLDRLAQTVPEWRERNPADVGVALVEAIAYAADRVSYQQDAAATEAYLATARLRPSVRRHARLVDYRLGEGRAARAWLCLEAEAAAEGTVVPAGTRVLPAALDLPKRRPATGARATRRHRRGGLRDAARAGAAGRPQRDRDPRLARRALLPARGRDLGDAARGSGDARPRRRCGAGAGAGGRGRRADLGRPPTPRRSTQQASGAGRRPDRRGAALEVRWHADDRLPFALTLDDAPGPVAGAVARANVVLAEHGLTVAEEEPLMAPPRRRFRPAPLAPGPHPRCPV